MAIRPCAKIQLPEPNLKTLDSRLRGNDMVNPLFTIIVTPAKAGGQRLSKECEDRIQRIPAIE